MMKTRLSVVVFVVALAGCASMSEEECRYVDWRTVGYEDGAAGQGAERLASRRKACAEHGVRGRIEAHRVQVGHQGSHRVRVVRDVQHQRRLAEHDMEASRQFDHGQAVADRLRRDRQPLPQRLQGGQRPGRIE